MIRRLLAVLLILALSSATAYAVSGYVEGSYDLLTQQWVWSIEAKQPVGRCLTLGATLTTPCDGVRSKVILPSWCPTSQLYEMWAEARHGPVSVRLTDWCFHWLSQSGQTAAQDKWGLGLSIRYEF